MRALASHILLKVSLIEFIYWKYTVEFAKFGNHVRGVLRLSLAHTRTLSLSHTHTHTHTHTRTHTHTPQERVYELTRWHHRHYHWKTDTFDKIVCVCVCMCKREYVGLSAISNSFYRQLCLNSLSGTIPTEISELTRLTILYV